MARLGDEIIELSEENLDEFAEKILEHTGRPDGTGIDLKLDFDEIEILANAYGLMRVGSSIHDAIERIAMKKGVQADKAFHFDLLDRRYITR
jgi:hypothetical protein